MVPKKRSRGQKIGLCKQWTDEQEERIRQHRKRIADQMRQIKKAKLKLNKVSVREILDAGVQIVD